jgi:hypothetical protein
MRLALPCLEHIIIVTHLPIPQPIFFLALPKLVRLFPRPQTCTLQVGVVGGEDYTLIADMEEGRLGEGDVVVSETPSTLVQLLRGIGVPDNVRVGLLVYMPRVWSTENVQLQLEHDVYPILEMRARMLAKAKGVRGGGHGVAL